jgi:hypothetical protein
VLAKEVLASSGPIDIRVALSIREALFLLAKTIKAESIGWAKRIRNAGIITRCWEEEVVAKNLKTPFGFSSCFSSPSSSGRWFESDASDLQEP